MDWTAASTSFVNSGMTAATAAATVASSALMIRKTRSVGKRSMSTDRGLRRSIVTRCLFRLFGQTDLAGVIVQRQLVIRQEVIANDTGDLGADGLRDMFQVDRDHLRKHL